MAKINDKNFRFVDWLSQEPGDYDIAAHAPEHVRREYQAWLKDQANEQLDEVPQDGDRSNFDSLS